jgi:hypothetical protein
MVRGWSFLMDDGSEPRFAISFRSEANTSSSNSIAEIDTT